MTTQRLRQLEAGSVNALSGLESRCAWVACAIKPLLILRCQHQNHLFACRAAKSVSGIFHRSASVNPGAICGLLPFGMAGGGLGR